jgi:hypothetical protein
VVARVVRAGKVLDEVPLRYAGVSSTFAGQLRLNQWGRFRLEVLAMDATEANFGMVSRSATVTR